MRVANALFRPIGKGCLGVSRVACTTAGPLRVCVCVCACCVYFEQHRIPRIFKQCAHIFYVHARAQWARLSGIAMKKNYDIKK